MGWNVAVELIQHNCWCGETFAIPQNLSRQYHEEGKSIYCPLGHTVVRVKTDVQKLQEKVADLEQQKKQLLTQNWAMEAKLKRVEKGVCPKCNRHFSNLERHFKTKHKNK